MNGGERRSDDTGLIGQNDIINIVIVGNNELASNQADLIARTAYQDIYNAYIGQPCGEVQINGITKRSESPVMFDEQHNVRTKNITLSIAYTEL